MKRFLIVLFCILSTSLCSFHASAQDDLMKQLQAEVVPAKNQHVLATFKGNKIVNIQTNETVKQRNLDVRINHLFGNIGAESGGSFHNLYGFDQSNDIRIALHYGITDRLMVGISRSKRQENLEGLVKYRLIEQTTDHRIPLAVTISANTTYSAQSAALLELPEHRMTYSAQLILARKFSSRFSLALVPSYLHRNIALPDADHDLISLCGGFRFKFTRSASIIADYSHTLWKTEPFLEHFDPIGVGVEIETGGHVFTVMFTNASGIIENDYLVNTVDDWGKGGVKFSFIISRMFRLGKS